MYKLNNFTVYSKKTPIINNVNCDIIVENEINIIFGDNAVGKTTLLNILNFNNFDYSGDVYYLGNNIKEFTANEVNQIRNTDFGILNQDLKLFDNLSVMDNLKIAANEIYEEEFYSDLLKKVNIRPDIFEEKVKKLSIGQKQRVAIARCILNGSKVLFFDEPTASLDAKNIEDFLGLIDDLKNSGITIIIITHDKIFLDIYDNFVEVENTKIIPSYFGESENKSIEVKGFKRPRKNKKIMNKLSGKMPLLTTLLLSAFIICFSFYVLLLSFGMTDAINDLGNTIPTNDIAINFHGFGTAEEYEAFITSLETNEK